MSASRSARSLESMGLPSLSPFIPPADHERWRPDPSARRLRRHRTREARWDNEKRSAEWTKLGCSWTRGPMTRRSCPFAIAGPQRNTAETRRPPRVRASAVRDFRPGIQTQHDAAITVPSRECAFRRRAARPPLPRGRAPAADRRPSFAHVRAPRPGAGASSPRANAPRRASGMGKFELVHVAVAAVGVSASSTAIVATESPGAGRSPVSSTRTRDVRSRISCTNAARFEQPAGAAYVTRSVRPSARAVRTHASPARTSAPSMIP